MQQARKSCERKFVEIGEIGIQGKIAVRTRKCQEKRRSVKQGLSLNYRLEQAATALAATISAGLFGWACALAVGLWGDSQTAKLPAWRPFALQAPSLDGAVPAAQTVSVGTMKLAGVAGDRAYFVGAGNAATRGLSLAVGESLPSGEKIVRIDRDAVVLASGGAETRVTVLVPRVDPTKKVVLPVAAGCRLADGDRASAIFMADGMVKALMAEKTTFARMFEPLPGASGGIRAKGTGGTTAMFAIADGDVLMRADGNLIRSSDAIVSELLARLSVGASVVVEGESKGAPRRWVYAPAACATGAAVPQPGEPAISKSASKASG